MTQGLDYNTQRSKMPMPEYGRGIFTMIEHALSLDDRSERQRCAENIIRTMRMMHPELRQQPDSEQKLWDHLAIMSDFKLDIDYPYDIESAHAVKRRPEPLPLPKHNVEVRHYGNLVFQMLDRIVEMPEGAERNALLARAANQMKRDLIQWGHTSSSEERVADDIRRFTNDKVELRKDFKFEHIQMPERKTSSNNKKKKK